MFRVEVLSIQQLQVWLISLLVWGGEACRYHHQPGQLHPQPGQLHPKLVQLHHQPGQLHHQPDQLDPHYGQAEQDTHHHLTRPATDQQIDTMTYIGNNKLCPETPQVWLKDLQISLSPDGRQSRGTATVATTATTDPTTTTITTTTSIATTTDMATLTAMMI